MNTTKKIWRTLVCVAVPLSLILAALAALGFSRNSVAGYIGRALPLIWASIAATGFVIHWKED